jgi:small-conductance mechanosensitive channel
MTTLEVLTALQNSAVAHAVSKSNHMVGAGLQIVHVLGFILLLASLVLVSLRLLGLAFADQPISKIGRDATRLIWLGLALAVISGTLMFVSSPRMYYYNPAFELKMLLLIVAVLVQVLLLRRVTAIDSPTPALARTSVALSLVFWFGVGLAGRIIGFI